VLRHASCMVALLQRPDSGEGPAEVKSDSCGTGEEVGDETFGSERTLIIARLRHWQFSLNWPSTGLASLLFPGSVQART
jgi:hypothetical protein